MPRRRGYISLLAVLVATNAQRGATPTGHALLLGTQRTGTTWAKEISNYNQVKAALRHTKFSKFIDADEARTRAAALKPQSLKPVQPRYDDRVRERSADEEKKRVEAIERQTAKVLAREEKKDQEYVSSFLAQLRAKAIESMHALLEAEADDDDA